VVATEQIRVFREYLSGNGLKYTRQRQMIAEVFFGESGHLSVTDILEKVKPKHSSVGYVTVYRMMKIMVESGLASERKFTDNHTLYEQNKEGEHHDHLICVICGRIVEFEDEVIELRQLQLAEEYGFKVVSHRHEIYVECGIDDCGA
jgi:Fur family ferric uptake transcriptional regulator